MTTATKATGEQQHGTDKEYHAFDCSRRYTDTQRLRDSEPRGLARLDALRQFVEPFAKQRCVLNPAVGSCIEGNREHPCRPCRARLALEGTGRVGLAKLTAPDLAELRATILAVIDDGCTCNTGEKHPWEFYEDGTEGGNVDAFTEDMANQQRLRFCDAIQAAAIVQRAAPATNGGKQ